MQANRYDLVISDIRMPGGDGLTMLKEIQGLSDPPPLIFVTAFYDLSLPEAQELGARQLLRKPFSMNQLTEIVSSVLGRSREHLPATE